MLDAPVHDLKRAKFPVVDYHNHLDAQDPGCGLKVMDECGIERIVNITMHVGNEASRPLGDSTGSTRPLCHLCMDGLERIYTRPALPQLH